MQHRLPASIQSHRPNLAPARVRDPGLPARCSMCPTSPIGHRPGLRSSLHEPLAAMPCAPPRPSSHGAIPSISEPLGRPPPLPKAYHDQGTAAPRPVVRRRCGTPKVGVVRECSSRRVEGSRRRRCLHLLERAWVTRWVPVTHAGGGCGGI
jgi:hypothetical protein